MLSQTFSRVCADAEHREASAVKKTFPIGLLVGSPLALMHQAEELLRRRRSFGLPGVPRGQGFAFGSSSSSTSGGGGGPGQPNPGVPHTPSSPSIPGTPILPPGVRPP